MLGAHLRFLSDDVLRGRAPGTAGADVAAAYIATQFELMGLEPAAPNGSFFQPVEMVGVTSDPSIVVGVRRTTTTLRHLEDFVAWSEQPSPSMTVDGDLVFVGYGVRAPGWDWDDYKGVSLRGKILLVMMNDPGLADSTRFDGDALTYYGWWTYKLEQAAREGAVGVIIIHSDSSATLPWSAVRSTWSGEQVRPDRQTMETLRFGAWITEQAARDLVAETGRDFDLLERRAQMSEFRPIPLDAHAVVHLRNSVRRIESSNVIARLPGGDSVRAREAVLLSAHYDHLGVRHPVDGDSVYNGALDNASGVSALISAAAGFSAVAGRPDRSVVFLAATAGESGFLGTAAYVADPAVPLEHTAALINLDRLNLLGATRDVVALGAERSDLAAYFRSAALAQALEPATDPNPAAGRFYRSDHLVFARAGVPVLSLVSGSSFLGREPLWGLGEELAYLAERYHQPGDEFSESFDYTGALQQVRLLMRLTWDLANTNDFPSWNRDSEYRPAGEQLRLRRLRGPAR
jgi:Zn-dependent M28 family amino/carboxypeptidase